MAFQDPSTLDTERDPDVLGVASDEASFVSLSGDDKPLSSSSDSERGHSVSLVAIKSLITPQVLTAGYTIEYSSAANRWSTLSLDT